MIQRIELPILNWQLEDKLVCGTCGIEITPEGDEKYDGLCFDCAEREFNARIMEEALAYGYGISPGVAIGGSDG